jgi:photosystem II stability/assembly factor-like uncharacterized protein
MSNGLTTDIDIRALAINSSDHIFAGTYYGSGGLFRSTDNGETWTVANNGLTHQLVISLVINSSGHIFAGSDFERGVFRSTDNGENWAEVNNGLINTSVQTLALNSNDEIFAGTGYWWEGNAGVFSSTDNGENWSEISNGLQPDHSVFSLTVNSLGHIFAGTEGAGIFRSTDNGANWTEINQGLLNKTVLAFTFNSNGYLFSGTEGAGVFRSKESTTPVENDEGVTPSEYALFQNYPNPFNPSTTIRYSIPNSEFVTLRVYDVLGIEVATLVNEDKSTGSYEIHFNATELSSGVYFYKLQAGNFVETKKMLLLK